MVGYLTQALHGNKTHKIFLVISQDIFNLPVLKTPETKTIILSERNITDQKYGILH